MKDRCWLAKWLNYNVHKIWRTPETKHKLVKLESNRIRKSLKTRISQGWYCSYINFLNVKTTRTPSKNETIWGERIHEMVTKNHFKKVIQVITKMRLKYQFGNYWYSNNYSKMILCDHLWELWNDFSHKAFTDIYKEL